MAQDISMHNGAYGTIYHQAAGEGINTKTTQIQAILIGVKMYLIVVRALNWMTKLGSRAGQAGKVGLQMRKDFPSSVHACP